MDRSCMIFLSHNTRPCSRTKYGARPDRLIDVLAATALDALTRQEIGRRLRWDYGQTKKRGATTSRG